MDVREGWYDDPRVPGQLRWWDGTAWTDHTHARPPADDPSVGGPGGTEGADAAPGDDLGWVGASSSGDGTGGSSGTYDAPEAAGDAGGWPDPTPAAATQARGRDDSFPAWGGPPVADRPVAGGNARVLVGVAVAAVVVVGAGLVAFDGSTSTSGDGGLFGGDTADLEVSGDERGTELTFGGDLTVGQRTAGTITPDGAWSVDLIVDAPTDVRIDVRGEPGFDPIATLYRDGDVLDRNDDRGGSRAEELGGDMLDPLLELDLAPGTYTLEVTGFGPSAGAFDVRVEAR